MKRCDDERSASPRRGCANEGCVRPAESGERWCAECGLERALYRRDRRAPAPQASGASRPLADRR